MTRKFERWLKLGFAFSFVTLNLFFLWTSYISHLPFNPADSLVLGMVGASQATGDVLERVDVLAMFLLGFSAFTTLALSRSLIRTVQLVSGLLMTLGFEVAAFDPTEFGFFVTTFQFTHDFALWFTNELMFFSASIVFVAATVVSLVRR